MKHQSLKRGPFQNDSWKITCIFENEIPSNMFLAFLFLSFIGRLFRNVVYIYSS